MLRVAFRYGDRRFFARLICLVQGGDAAHCEAADHWGREPYLNWLRHECVSSSWVDGGVRRKVMDLPPEKWRVYEVPGDADDLRRWFVAYEGAGYDWLGLLGFLLRRVRGFRRRWFCSEACAAVLQLHDPWRFDVALLESVCARLGQRVY